jgi:dTDP-4-amino-4,6-dideoxygalactose transaminase
MSDKKNIPHFRPSTDFQDIKAVTRVIKSGWLSNGSAVRDLEKTVVKLSNQKFGIGVNSGTSALHLALLALGVGAGDEVVVSSYVCVGLAHVIRYTGAIPVPVDVNESDGNMNVASLTQAITSKTKAIIVPHMFGLMADMEEILKVANGIPVIEDCAMSPGSKLSGRPAGSFGELATFSVYATKMITGGEGGIVTTSNQDYRDELEDRREYDKKLDDKIRYNYKMNDLSAALALSQLKKLKNFIRQRKVLARKYTQELENLPLILPQVPKSKKHIFYRYVVKTKKSNELRQFLKKQGIICGYGVVGGLHRVLHSTGSFPMTDQWLDQGVSLPIYPNLTDSQIKKIVYSIKDFYHGI